MYTPKIEKAIRVAARLHSKQMRKDKTTPYITHLFSVMLIVSEYTDDEETLVAALLHDALEDTQYTADELEKDFGSIVRIMVEDLTLEREQSGKHVPWREDRENYLKRLEKATHETMIVCAADKIHNLDSWFEYKTSSDQWKRDQYTKSRDSINWFYGEVLKVLEKHLDSPIVNKLKKSFVSL